MSEKTQQTVVQAHRSASSRHTTRWSLLAASTAEHNRPGGTESDDSQVCGIAASKRHCRWAPEPGTVSVVVSLCVVGRTDSIHLAPERVDDHANSLVAGRGIVGVADIKLDCHGDLAFVAREVPAIEVNICGFHECHVAVSFVVGFAHCFAVARFRHDESYRGRIWGFCTRTRMC